MLETNKMIEIIYFAMAMTVYNFLNPFLASKNILALIKFTHLHTELCAQLCQNTWSFCLFTFCVILLHILNYELTCFQNEQTN